MDNYSPMKTRMVWFAVLVLSVFFAVVFTACETKKPVVNNTEPVTGKPVTTVSEPKTPKEPEPSRPLIEMVLVKGGEFRMGNPGSMTSRQRDRSVMPNNEWPNHRVTLRDFYIGKYEVTQGQYTEVTGLNPSGHLTNPSDNDPDSWMNLPVENVNWYNALVFCNKLSIKEKLKPVYSINDSVDPDVWLKLDPRDRGGAPTRRSPVWDAVKMDMEADGYRLPTEAEWEYAARGGAESKGYIYAGSDNSTHVAWHSVNNARGFPVGSIHEVGKKQPNELDLYDMSGNVMEWCWDWLGEYTVNDQNNPIGPPRGNFRIIRGGGWSFVVYYCRTLYRHSNDPHFIAINLGFRVARNK